MRKKIRVILSYTFATTLVFAMITGCGSKSKNAENKTAKIVELSDKETTNKDDESAKDEKTAKTEADSKTEAASKEETTSETEMTAKTEETTIIQPTEQEQTESFDVEPMNTTMYINGNANVRKGPGTNYESLGKLQRGKALSVLGKSGEWYQVEYYGDYAYVHQSLLQNDAPTNEQSDTYAGAQPGTQPGSKPEAPPASQQVGERYVVDYVIESETLPAEKVKYGVTRIPHVKNYYYVYSDNSRELYNTYTDYEYDHSGYNASEDDLKVDTESVAVANRAYYEEVLRLVNEIRAEAGVGPLKLDDSLCKASTMRALEMGYSDTFSHTRPDGRQCFSVLSYYNISHSSAGENIAAGYTSPAEVVEGWKNSEGHYANMIGASFTKLGVGYFNSEIGGWGNYWVQMFTN